MTSITVRLLGSLEMRDAQGRELSSLPSQRKRFGLLSYLATAQPRGFHSRDKLLGLFWPEATREQARHALNQALHVLRTELGEEAIRSRGDSDVAIDERLISCDVVAFELAVEVGDHEEALELYRGDLLEGLFVREAPEFERWLDDERTRLRELAAGAAWALAHQHISAGRLVDAERTAQRALLLVPTDESEVRRFIQALADAGDRAAAVRFYEKFAHRLRSAYELAPDPATAAVARALATAPADPPRTMEAPGNAPAAAQVGIVTPSDGMTPTHTSPVRTVAARRTKLRVGVAVAAVVAVVIAAALLRPRSGGRALDRDRVLVVALEDESGRDETAILGRWAQDYILQILTDAGFADVLDPQSAGVAERAEGSGDILALAYETGASTVVSGSYYVAGDSVYVRTRITDARDGSLMGTVGPVVGSLGPRGEWVARLGQEVVARLASLLDHQLESFEPTVRPATYEAYEAYSEGFGALWGGGGTVVAARHFERAGTIDTTFYRAMLWATHSYLWSGPPYQSKVESLITTLEESRAHLTRYERCRLDFLTAIAIRPSLWTAYDAAHCMERAAPGYAKPKDEVAFLALRTFRPREAIEVLKGLDQRDPVYWERLCMAYHMLGSHETELAAAREGMRQFPGTFYTVRAEARALAALNRVDEVKARVPAMLPLETVAADVADELRVHGHPAAAREILDSAIVWREMRGDPEGDLAELLYHAERWDEAWELAQERAKTSPTDPQILAFLGVLAARRDDRETALHISEELSSPRYVPLMRSWLTLQRAKIAALLGDSLGAMNLLRQGISHSPAWSYPQWPHRDIDFESLHDYPPFQELLRPKG